MADCKCFLNDQLLPVRAGCAAIWCKDVNSHTAIRDEALARIAALRVQLQQAQEAGRALSGKLLDAVTLGEQFKAERDAAIERGEAAERVAARRNQEMWQLTVSLIVANDAWHREDEKRQRAETDAAEQRAMAEELTAVLGDWPADAHSEICAFILSKKPCNCGFQAREMFATYPPAEALRAKHRSPQSGQEEGFGHSHKHRHNERDAASHIVNDPALPGMAGREHTHDHPPTGHHAEALRAVRAKHRTPPSGEHRSPQSGQEEGD